MHETLGVATFASRSISPATHDRVRAYGAAVGRLRVMTAAPFEDPMEWVEHYWTERGFGDATQFVLMGSVLRLQQLIVAEIDRVLKPYELTRTAYLVLATIELSAHRSRLLSRIAAHMLVHPTTITLVVDKLESQGLVQREAHPADRRATYARITPAGSALMKEATRALAVTEFGLPGLSAADRRKMTKLIASTRQAAGDVDTSHVEDLDPTIAWSGTGGAIRPANATTGTT